MKCAHLHNRMPWQKLEPQTFQSLCKHSTTELSWYLMCRRVFPLHFMQADLVWELPWGCPLFLIIHNCQLSAQLSCSLLQVFMKCKASWPFHFMHVYIIWELLLFTSCTLLCLERSPLIMSPHHCLDTIGYMHNWANIFEFLWLVKKVVSFTSWALT